MVVSSNKFKAFTLAEVLITLGIIGVIAALTIPALLANYQKTKTISQLKKVYTSLAQAVKTSEGDNGNNKDWDWGGGSSSLTERASFDTYWAPYLKILRYCSTVQDCGYSVTNPWKFANGVTNNTNPVSAGRTSVLLSDGTFMFVRNNTEKVVYIDLNAGQGPNVSGKDFFIFELDTNKGFVPYRFSDSINTINNACITWNDAACAAKLMVDGWEMKSDYPW